jgi:hypothetical protein
MAVAHPAQLTPTAQHGQQDRHTAQAARQAVTHTAEGPRADTVTLHRVTREHIPKNAVMH